MIYLYQNYLNNPRFTSPLQKILSPTTLLVAGILAFQESGPWKPVIYVGAFILVAFVNYWDYSVSEAAKKREKQLRDAREEHLKAERDKLRSSLAQLPANTLDAYLQLLHGSLLAILDLDTSDPRTIRLRICVHIRDSLEEFLQITDYAGDPTPKKGRSFSIDQGFAGRCLGIGERNPRSFSFPKNKPQQEKSRWLKDEFGLIDTPRKPLNLEANSWLYIPLVLKNPWTSNLDIIGCVFMDSRKHQLFGSANQVDQRIDRLCFFFSSYLKTKLDDMIQRGVIVPYWVSNQQKGWVSDEN